MLSGGILALVLFKWSGSFICPPTSTDFVRIPRNCGSAGCNRLHTAGQSLGTRSVIGHLPSTRHSRVTPTHALGQSTGTQHTASATHTRLLFPRLPHPPGRPASPPSSKCSDSARHAPSRTPARNTGVPHAVARAAPPRAPRSPLPSPAVAGVSLRRREPAQPGSPQPAAHVRQGDLVRDGARQSIHGRARFSRRVAAARRGEAPRAASRAGSFLFDRVTQIPAIGQAPSGPSFKPIWGCNAQGARRETRRPDSSASTRRDATP